MAVTRSHPVFAITFAVTYAILYVLAVEHNWALFTYHPVAEEFHFLVERAADGPSMYWYGWMATAGLGALFISAIVARLPGGANQPPGDRSFLGDSTGHDGYLCLSHEGLLFPVKLA